MRRQRGKPYATPPPASSILAFGEEGDAACRRRAFRPGRRARPSRKRTADRSPRTAGDRGSRSETRRPGSIAPSSLGVPRRPSRSSEGCRARPLSMPSTTPRSRTKGRPIWAAFGNQVKSRSALASSMVSTTRSAASSRQLAPTWERRARVSSSRRFGAPRHRGEDIGHRRHAADEIVLAFRGRSDHELAAPGDRAGLAQHRGIEAGAVTDDREPGTPRIGGARGGGEPRAAIARGLRRAPRYPRPASISSRGPHHSARTTR